jgi:HAD superfamily hydrolase (TIGR01459 family)
MSTLTPITGLCELAGRYGALLVDQFGTLHDGTVAYPHAAEALRRFREGGGKVVVLSNSAKTGADNVVRLAKFGFGTEHFDAVVTSGDAAQAAIRAGSLGAGFAPGAKVHLSGKPGDDYGFGDLGFTLTWPDEAEGIILAASQEPDRNWREQIRDLTKAANRGVTVAVCNPDLEMLTPKGVRPSAGAIALELERKGAVLRYFGKPHADIYRTALTALGNPPPLTVLAIGDSPEHDIAGAAGVGLDSLLLRTGILSEADESTLTARLPKKAGRVFSLAELRW